MPQGATSSKAGAANGKIGLSRELGAIAKTAASFETEEQAYSHFRTLNNIPNAVSREFGEKFGAPNADGYPTKSMRAAFKDFYNYATSR